MAEENLPTVNLSVLSFCKEAKSLEAEDHSKFVRFVLMGEKDDKRVVIHPILNKVPPNEPFSVQRDYDSVLGICKDVLVDNYLSVSPLGKPNETLAVDVHIKHHFENSRGPFEADLHKVPNIGFATWGTRNMIRVFLPELYSDNRHSAFLTPGERKIFYEEGLLPAMRELLQERATEWPSRYDDEMFRARGRNGQLNFQSKIVPRYLVSNIGDYLRSSFVENDCLWGTGLVFLHQIRGLKETHRHNDDWAEEALDDFFYKNDMSLAAIQERGEWWVDAAIEVHSDANPAKSLAWRTDSHFSLVREALDLSDNHADRITRPGSSKYSRDMLAHLPAVSGCRISPGSRARGPYQARYFQMYTTDKALTYRPGDGKFSKQLSVPEVMNGKYTAYVDSLYELYCNAVYHSRAMARLEVRVPLRHASAVLIGLDRELLRESLVSFRPTVLWSLRAYRALAIKYLLAWQAEGEWTLRAKRSALLLTAGCVWLLNGLHSTHDQGSSSKELMAAILPHTRASGADPDVLAYGTPASDDEFDFEDGSSEDSEDEEPAATTRRRDATTLPCFNRGLVFFRPIRLGENFPVPRFYVDEQFLSEKAFKYFFKKTRAEVRQTLFEASTKRSASGSRVRNRARQTVTWVNFGQVRDKNLFKLSERGLRLPTPPHDGGSDVDDGSNASDDDAGQDIDSIMTKLWRQFLLDITSKAPNMKNAGQPSYCKLDADARCRVSDETYRNPKLSDYFRACSYKLASSTDWQTIFDRFFPPKEQEVATKIQNYSSAKWWNKWLVYKSTADAETVEACRKALYKRFKKLYWMPFAQSDRIWKTKADKRFTKLGSSAAAPLILINSFTKPTW